MADLTRYFTLVRDFYVYLMYDIADPRTNDWFLIGHPTIFIIIFSYIYFVRVGGQKYMKNREPFEFKNSLVIYNFLQVIISIYLFREGFYYGWFNGYSFKCQPVDYSNDPKALRAAHAVYWYFLAKVFELLDTIIFVLRKKNNQVSLLHVYHHSVMPLISWGATKYYPGGHCTFIGFINSFTHIIMYFYYMLAAMGPRFQKYLWWKKYITTLQLIQFCMIFVHGSLLWVYDCGFPKWTSWMIMPNVVFFYYLFSEFYKTAYIRRLKQFKERTINGLQQKNGNGFTTNLTKTISDFTIGLSFKKLK